MTRTRYPVPADEPDAREIVVGRTPSGRRQTMRKYDPRSIASPGQGLADLYPALYEQAVRCTKYPELPLARLVPQSNLTLVWRCRCTNETLRKVNNVINRGRAVCDRCQSSGKSRLEYEIAEVLRAGLGVEVLTHHARAAMSRSISICPPTTRQ